MSDVLAGDRYYGALMPERPSDLPFQEDEITPGRPVEEVEPTARLEPEEYKRETRSAKRKQVPTSSRPVSKKLKK